MGGGEVNKEKITNKKEYGQRIQIVEYKYVIKNTQRQGMEQQCNGRTHSRRRSGCNEYENM